MAKVIFHTFQEASVFSKHLAMTTMTTTTIHRDGDSWWVDGPSIDNIDTANVADPCEATNLHKQTIQYDAHGFDLNGLDKNGNGSLLSENYDLDNNKYVVSVLGNLIESEEHRDIIMNYYSWLRRLATGNIRPVNEDQRQFVSNVNSNNITNTYEYICITYRERMDIGLSRLRDATYREVRVDPPRTTAYLI